MTFETFMEELRKIPDKNMLLQDYLSPYYVSDFKISDNHLILIIKNDYNKSCSICSLARQLLSLENIKDVYVSYSNGYYKVNRLIIIRDRVIVNSSLYNDITISL